MSSYEEISGEEIDRGKGSDPYALAGTHLDLSNGREALASWWNEKNIAERYRKSMERQREADRIHTKKMEIVANMERKAEQRLKRERRQMMRHEYDTSNDAGYYSEFDDFVYSNHVFANTTPQQKKPGTESFLGSAWTSDSGEVSLGGGSGEKASNTPTWVIAFMIFLGISVTGFSAFLLVQDYFSESEAFVAPIPEEAELFEADSDRTYTGPPSISTDWEAEFEKIEYEDEDNQGGIVIPSVDIYSEMIATGAENGSLVLPNSPKSTWYENSTPVGGTIDDNDNKVGNSIIASHVNHIDGQELAPFSRLNQVESGTPISVRDHDGIMYEYEVVEMSLYERSAIPEEYFRTDGDHQLHLVTCSGEIIEDNDANDLAYFEYNLVITAELVEQ